MYLGILASLVINYIRMVVIELFVVKRDDQITDINAAGESRDFERKLFRNFFWGEI